VVIVPPEGDLEFQWDAEMCWCLIHVTVKIVSGTTQRSVIELGITNGSSQPETVRLGRKEGEARSVSLGHSLRLPFFSSKSRIARFARYADERNVGCVCH